jgi:hypothetical protein
LLHGRRRVFWMCVFSFFCCFNFFCCLFESSCLLIFNALCFVSICVCRRYIDPVFVCLIVFVCVCVCVCVCAQSCSRRGCLSSEFDSFLFFLWNRT